MAAITPDVANVVALEEKKKLRKSFGLLDMIFYTLATILGLDTLGAVSSQGGQVLSWLLISAITFLIPYGLLVSELGTAFPQEGGMYGWCKMAGGGFFAALGAMLYWISNPLWLGGTLSVTAIAAIKILWFNNPKLLLGGTQLSDAIIELAIAMVFIWATVWCTTVSLAIGKWLAVFGSYVKLALLGIFVLLALVFFFGGHATGQHLGFTDVLPTGNWGLILSAILPILIFNWVGFEVQNGAGEEMHNPQRDVPLSLIRAGALAVIAYTIPIAIILFTLTKSQLSSASGFVQAFQTVSSVLPAPLGAILGWATALGVILALASSGGSWIIGANRAYAVAALDRAAPIVLGRFSKKYGTPIGINIFSGVVSTVAMGAAIFINSFGAGNIGPLFQLVLGFAISTTTLSYLFIFPAFLLLRYKYPDAPRPYRVPGGMIGAWVVTLLTFAYAAFASYYILIPSDATVTSSGISRLTYEVTEIAAIAIIILLTGVFYIWGHRERRTVESVGEVA